MALRARASRAVLRGHFAISLAQTHECRRQYNGRRSADCWQRHVRAINGPLARVTLSHMIHTHRVGAGSFHAILSLLISCSPPLNAKKRFCFLSFYCPDAAICALCADWWVGRRNMACRVNLVKCHLDIYLITGATASNWLRFIVSVYSSYAYI